MNKRHPTGPATHKAVFFVRKVFFIFFNKKSQCLGNTIKIFSKSVASHGACEEFLLTT